MKIEVGKMYDSKESGQVKVIERIAAGRTVEGEELVKILDACGREFNITKEHFLNNYKLLEEKEFITSKPAHYDTAIDTIAFAKANFTREQVEGFMRINAIKYLQRYDKKNGADDIRKGIVYMNELLKHVEEGKE